MTKLLEPKPKLLAYHGKQEIKDKYLARVRDHREADELIKGAYGEWKNGNGKGCAVGCTIHGRNHAAYETEMGIPQAIARLEDGIFEGLPEDESQQWPERFLSAITPGADLSLVADKFLHWLLVDPVDGVVKFAKTDKQRAAISRVGELYANKLAGIKVSLSDWQEARRDAYAYAYAADAAAAAAADAAADADADADAYAYASAADAAAYADAADAADAARLKARIIQSNKLVELLQNAPV
jgi:hypothetical protein